MGMAFRLVAGIVMLCPVSGATEEQSRNPIQDPALRAYVEHVDREWPGESHSNP